MKLTQNKIGLSVIALAVVLAAGAGIADTMPKGHGIAAADADGDGKVTQAEFEAWRAARVTGLDANKDGFISADELAAARVKMATDEAQAMAERMVARLDADKDGKLSAAELADMPMPGFDRMDRNGDGVIDQAEMQAGHGMRGEGMGHGHHHKMGQGGDMMGQGGDMPMPGDAPDGN